MTFLGVVIVYIFALASFAFLRNSMESTGEDSTLYCGSLVECTVSVLRYGLIGELFEVIYRHGCGSKGPARRTAGNLQRS